MGKGSLIRTSAEQLSNIEIKDGQLIFVRDSKKLYLDCGEQRIPFAGGIYVEGNGVSITEDEQGQKVIDVNDLNIEIKEGNWWINGEDTGITAEGKTPVILIDPETKMWIINDVSTGVVAAADTISQSDFQLMTELLEDINTKIEQALEEGV